ncbi:aconitate hydratase AcnA [Desulfuromonas sp. KJ2020]|uniref:aconitate hydratase AcnA n=1 Tax=Desulfuromonas sp. KJ2020 TaxID=2919173 RepID=UPI0020A74975|nr:aconitate hydratase AcnA [Desulfuromonas sp. KJ2020]MCP3175791.1 aconitate hydratase AcnA [Desulfuromonas sp. KJ2020]
MHVQRTDTLKTKTTLTVDGRRYDYFSLPAAERAGLGDLSRLPFSLKILLENLLRFEDGQSVTVADIEALGAWLKERSSSREIAFRPARVLMQDFTGVPAVVDLAALRDAMARAGGDPEKINPRVPVDLIIDHSVTVDRYGSKDAFAANVAAEMARNHERYALLRWGQKAFANFRVVPPGTGICHQVNLEYLGQTVWSAEENDRTLAYPDTLVGTDSHTPMINGLGILGWGVGGIEAEAAMLGQPISMLIPEVVGFRLHGSLAAGVTATDLVLTVTQMLREFGVVGKFVEFFGPGLDHLPIADRATIANMSPEYGATCGFFPVDRQTLDYLRFTGRDGQTLALVEAYAKAQGLWRDEKTPAPLFTDVVELDLGQVVPSLAGPKRPQDRVALPELPGAMDTLLADAGQEKSAEVKGAGYRLLDGDLVIAAITSCTNTSNPAVMMAAGLLAQKALEKGLSSKPWVKTSLAPGSKVVSDYLAAADLQKPLDALGFQLVGYGCTTCIGNSGPLDEPIAAAVREQDLTVCAVLSGNRNFEGRIHPQVKASWLASPPLVVAYALAGTMRIDLSKEPLGEDRDGQPVYLGDIWPTAAEVARAVEKVTAEMFHQEYADVFRGEESWRTLPVPEGKTFAWDPDSTYVKEPPFFLDVEQEHGEAAFAGARILALLGDTITTDHISPAGSIRADSPAGEYLQQHGVKAADFNSYGSRRGNHEVMMRGTFANIRLRNEMVPQREGGYTRHIPSGEEMSLYDAAMRYGEEGTPLVIIAGAEYGTGSSRDWAAKGSRLLGIRAIIAESFERIHRSNLVGMGVLPLQFEPGVTRVTLGLDGSEQVDLLPPAGDLRPGMTLQLVIRRQDGGQQEVAVRCRIDTADEIAYFHSGGILHHVLRRLLKTS